MHPNKISLTILFLLCSIYFYLNSSWLSIGIYTQLYPEIHTTPIHIWIDRNPTQKEVHQRTGIAETPVNIDRGRAASPPESTIYLWVFYQSYYSLNVVFIGFIWYLSWVSFLCLLIAPTRESTCWELISLEKTTSPLSDNFTKIESCKRPCKS